MNVLSLLVERIGVDVEQPELGLAEDEGEGVEDVICAEPDVLAALGLDSRAEVAAAPDEAVRPVGCDDEVGVAGHGRRARCRSAGRRPSSRHRSWRSSSSRFRAIAENAWPSRTEDAAAVADVDPVPPHERVGDRQVRLGVGVAERPQRLLAEDHAPAERRIGRVPLGDLDVDGRIRLLEQDRQVEPCGAAADDRDLHLATASARRSSWPTSDTVGKRTSSSHPASS